MDIAAMSTQMAMQSVQNAISISVMQKSMNKDASMLTLIDKTFENVAQPQQAPSFGHILDTRA